MDTTRPEEPTTPGASDADDADVEGHNFEFYRQEARQRAADAEAQARAAARARDAKKGSDSTRRA